jgi:xanthine dehydrogenase accessory factor
MKEIYEEIVRLLNEGKRVILATVIQQAGSAPRKSGAQMVIREDGSIVGSVGGGRLEADVLREAKALGVQGTTKVLAFHLTGKEVAETDMLCGGNVEVFLEYLPLELKEIYAELLEIKKRGEEAALVTLITDDPLRAQAGTKKLIFPDGRGLGPLSFEKVALAEAQEVLKAQESRLLSCRGEMFYVESIFSEPTLYIFGAGHISRYLAPLAHMVGFRVVVIDDRAEHANQDNFPQADEIWVERFESIGEKVDSGEESYMVIVTRGHLHDYTVLQQVLRKDARYVGMIGSRRKRDIVYQQLSKDGVDQEQLTKIHSPIGLNINAETPEEIAVSIVAELIKVRGEGKTPREKNWKV